MTLTVRIYQTEENAKAVDKALSKAGFANHALFLPSKLKGQERAAIEEAIDRGSLPERKILLCTRMLQEGRSIVSVDAPFGSGQAAERIMDRINGVDGDLITRYMPSDPAPLSQALNLPVLSRTRPATSLLSPQWYFSSIFGIRMLSSSAAPLSSLFGMSTLTRSKGNWTKSLGMPLLSKHPAPLSSLFGMTTVLKAKRSWNWSWGLPLLSDNPAPLSNLLGIKTLSDDQ